MYHLSCEIVPSDILRGYNNQYKACLFQYTTKPVLLIRIADHLTTDTFVTRPCSHVHVALTTCPLNPLKMVTTTTATTIITDSRNTFANPVCLY